MLKMVADSRGWDNHNYWKQNCRLAAEAAAERFGATVVTAPITLPVRPLGLLGILGIHHHHQQNRHQHLSIVSVISNINNKHRGGTPWFLHHHHHRRPLPCWLFRSPFLFINVTIAKFATRHPSSSSSSSSFSSVLIIDHHHRSQRRAGSLTSRKPSWQRKQRQNC